ncbi:MAG: hypothetical protein K6B72_05055, partial [Lachnospiraceae bacterium]|nr:hypothetical protein [Lachnospiraceae bacterium]
MKNLMWKRIVAGIGAAAIIAGNVVDAMPNVAYAAEETPAAVEEMLEEGEIGGNTATGGEPAAAEEPAGATLDGQEGLGQQSDDGTAGGFVLPDDESLGNEGFGDEGLGDDFSDDGYRLEDDPNEGLGDQFYLDEEGYGNDLEPELTEEQIGPVNITVSVVDTFGNEIDSDYTMMDLPRFRDSLILDDPDSPPISRVRKQTGSFGPFGSYSPDYDYVQATVYGSIITTIYKEEIEGQDYEAYFYEVDGVKIRFTEDATVMLEYSPQESVESTYVYSDSSMNLRLELEDPAAVPDEAYVEVTRVDENTPGYSYDAYAQALHNTNEALSAENTIFYDIAFMMEDWEVEPAHGAVKVSMEFLQQQLTGELKAETGSDIVVTHMALPSEIRKAYSTTASATDLTAADINAYQVMTAGASAGTGDDVLEFSLDSFSVIAVTRVERSDYNREMGLADAVRVKATLVDEFLNPLSEEYTGIDLPEFDEVLMLDDPTAAPFTNVRTVKPTSGLIKRYDNYDYVQATLDGETIKGLKKVALQEGGYSWLYTLDGEEWLPIEQNAEILFVYALAGNERTSFVYEDGNARVTAVLSNPEALPAGTELKVTPIVPGDKNYDAYMEALNGGEEGSYSDENTLLYDIAFLAPDENGNVVEFQPEEGSVRVTIEFLQNQLTEDIEAESTADIEVTHLPLTDEAKAASDTTLNANITADDIEVKDVEATVSVEGAEQVSFTETDFSVFAIKANSNKEFTVSNPGSETSKGLLGDAWIYGITANTWNFTGDSETNFAVKVFNAGGPQTGATNSKVGEQSTHQYIMAGTVNGSTIIKGKEATLIVPEYEKGKFSFSLENGAPYHWKFDTKENIEKKVGNMLAYVAGQSTRLAGLDSVGDYSKLPGANGHMTLDITKADPGTYYIDVDKYPALKNRLRENGQVHIKKNSNQNIVFNFSSSTEIRIDKILVSTDGGAEIDTASLANKPTTELATIETLIFNAPNATKVTVNDAAGIFLFPNAEVHFTGVGGGWLVCDVAKSGAEWHFTNGHLPEPD